MNRPTILTLLFLFFSVQIQAATVLSGIITYQNTGQAVKAIQVTARGASPTITRALSDNQGIFKLVFSDKKPGEIVVLSITNRTYDLVNHTRELEIILPEEGVDKQIRLVVCKKGERDQNAVKYYEISTEFITKSYEREQARLTQKVGQLNSDIARVEGNVEELQQQLEIVEKEKDELYQVYQSQIDKAWLLAENFSRIDLAQADSIYREAFSLFKEGEIEKARKVLKGQARQDNLIQINEKEKELKEEEANLKAMKEAIATQQKKIDQERKELEEGKAREIRSFHLAAQMAEIQFDFDDAKANLVAAITLDSTNVETLLKLAEFHNSLRDQKSAMDYYQRALRHTKTKGQKAKTLDALALELSYNQEFEEAKKNHLQAITIFNNIIISGRESYQSELAIAQNRLGDLYYDKGDFQEAEPLFEEALQTFSELAANDSAAYLSKVAMVQNNLANLSRVLHNYEKAEEYYLEAIKNMEYPMKEVSQQIQGSRIATGYNNLAVMYLELNNSEKAEKALLKAAEIRKELAKISPRQFEFDLAETETNLGTYYSGINDYESANEAYGRAEKIFRKLAIENPERFQARLALILDNLGKNYSSLYDQEKAITTLNESKEIYEKLAVDNPDVHEPELIRVQNSLGNAHLSIYDYEKAEKAFLKGMDICEKYAKINPDRFEPTLAMILNNLGRLYSDFKDLEKAIQSQERACQILERLIQKNTQRFEPSLANIQNNLAFSYYAAGMLDKAEFYFRKNTEIYTRLSKENPAAFLPDLAIGYMNLGLIITQSSPSEAESALLKADSIFADLAPSQPNAFQVNLFKTKRSLGLLYNISGEYKKAEYFLLEAKKIIEPFAAENPSNFELDLANVQFSLGMLYQNTDELQKMEGAIIKAIEIFDRIKAVNPDYFNYTIWGAWVTMATSYQYKMIMETDLKWQEKGLKFAKAAEEALLSCSEDFSPLIPQMKAEIKKVIALFENATLETLQIEQRIMEAAQIELQIEKETDLEVKTQKYEEVIKILSDIQNDYPNYPPLNSQLANACGELAALYIHSKKFEEAEQIAQKGLKVDPSQNWINANLALGLLFQGKFKLAKAIYLELKDQEVKMEGVENLTFKQAFLRDLDDLEAAGTIHPDVKKIRKLLQK